MEITKLLLYVFMASQMVAWIWFSSRGGKLSDRGFLVFTLAMLLGQTGAAIESLGSHAWGTGTIQIVFFVSTVIGGITRFRQTHHPKLMEVI